MHRSLISFGANIGDARGSVLAAKQLLCQLLPAGDQVMLSRLYETPPVGGPSGQAPFINAVAAVETRLNPWELWHVIRSIEQQLGRERIKRWEARRIDLDILLFDHQRIWTPQLKIPHPRMCMRRFILEPAANVAADWLDPVSQMSIGALANRLSDGPGSLVLACAAETDSQEVLRKVAGQSEVKQISVSEMLTPAIGGDTVQRCSQRLAAQSESGWLVEHLAHPLVLDQTLAKLIVFWVESADNSAWEDQHRELAGQLRLANHETTRRPAAEPLPFVGPRYLLATNDRQWAAHEIASALEAMDCLVEVVR